jgi:hypothetical protein
MNHNDAKLAQIEEQDLPSVEVMDLFAEELPEQNDLAAVATTFSSLSSASSGSCPASTAGTLTTASSLG